MIFKSSSSLSLFVDNIELLLSEEPFVTIDAVDVDGVSNEQFDDCCSFE
jgi:hypothetical protein